MKKLSVIIPTLNEEAHIATTLHRADLPGVECIVADGGSTDHTRDIAQTLKARIIQTPPGRARQMNAGAAAAEAKTLLFLHADTLPPARFPSIIKFTLKQPATAAGAFSFKLDQKGVWLHFIELLANLRASLFQLPYGEQGLFIRKHLFDELDGFPETPILEDYIFARRLRRYGTIRITISSATSSARRWNTNGPFRVALLDQLTVIGFRLRIPLTKLARFYRKAKSEVRSKRDVHPHAPI